MLWPIGSCRLHGLKQTDIQAILPDPPVRQPQKPTDGLLEMRVKDFDNFRYPNRKPWLAAILIVLVGYFLIQRYTGRGKTEKVPEKHPVEKVKKMVVAEQKRVERSVDVDQLLTNAKASEAQNALVEARTKYLEVLKRSDNFKVRTEVEQRLAKVNVELVMTPMAMPGKVDYVVKRGDSVDKIAKKFDTTVELIQKSNHIKNSNLIKAGDWIRVFTGKFAIRVSKGRNDLLLYMNDEFFKRYRVGTGKYDRTPDGTFTIAEKINEPAWWRPDGKEVPYGDPENILGTRWMTLRTTGDTPDVRGYGIHGTWDNNTVGKSVSAGCIRLINSDVEELFTLVPMETPVVIE